MGQSNTKATNYGLLRSFRSRATSELNELYVLTLLSVTSLQALEKDIYSQKRRAVPVTVISRHGEIQTTKRRKYIREFIRKATTRGLYCNAVVSAVALVEDCIASYLKLILTAYPEKIGKDRKLSVEELQMADDIASAMHILVNKEIVAALYKSPKEYLDYFQRALSIELDAGVIAKYIEIKATRDLLIHNAGIVNAVYLEKAGKEARGKSGKTIPVSKIYFDSSVIVMKELVHSIFEKILAKHGESERVAQSNNRFHATGYAGA